MISLAGIMSKIQNRFDLKPETKSLWLINDSFLNKFMNILSSSPLLRLNQQTSILVLSIVVGRDININEFHVGNQLGEFVCSQTQMSTKFAVSD